VRLRRRHGHLRADQQPGVVLGRVAWHSAFQENLTLLLVEAYYGFVMGDKYAFVAYTHAAGS
jgi:hypothetical protein